MSTTSWKAAWNIWGHCERCDRWFQRPDERDAAWTCPGCGVRPLHIENRGPVTATSRRTRRQ